VRFASNFIAGLILVAWFLATNHSLLVAVVPNTGSDACCAEVDEYPENHDPLRDCGICFIEVEGILTFASGRFLFCEKFSSNWESSRVYLASNSSKTTRLITDRSPPDLASWHFENRNALLGRSPSNLL
jgi:hypothetical protein|tara:strand:+ start:384 stop:770 length:387 start_codon:yes stop_codon:yes gene_type:complete